MPTPPALAEPSTARDRRPPTEIAAVATLLPDTTAPIVAAPARPVAPVQAAQAQPELGVFQRLKRWLAGAPAAEESEQTPAPASRSPNRERSGSHHRDRDHRHGGHSPRRHASDDVRRDGRGRDRNRDRDRDRGERSGSRDRNRDRDRDRGRDRGREASGNRAEQPQRNNGPDQAAAPAPSEPAFRTEQAPTTGVEGEPVSADPGLRPDRGEQPRRGRRGGRRRGRRGGGGGNRGEGAGTLAGGAPRDANGNSNGPDSGNESSGGSYESSSLRESFDSGGQSAPSAPAYEPPAPAAHFEPPAQSPAPGRPHVVWSSAPSGDNTPGGYRGPEE